jgi:hypothetical protein
VLKIWIISEVLVEKPDACGQYVFQPQLIHNDVTTFQTTQLLDGWIGQESPCLGCLGLYQGIIFHQH